MHLLVITGLSGSGKTSAAHALEDLGYFCVDNLPVVLLPSLLDLLAGLDEPIERLAVVMDIREGPFLAKYGEILDGVRGLGVRVEMFFLEASTEVLVRRFEATGRPHPLANDRTLMEGIKLERERLAGLRRSADRIVDTSFFHIHQIRKYLNLLCSRSEPGAKRLQIELISFGYANGIPIEADLIMDVRFLPNPHYVPELRDRDGRDLQVQKAIQSEAESCEILDRFFHWVEAMVAFYEKEDRAYFKLGFGCTGGKHRSVGVVALLDKRLRDLGYSPKVIHRELM